MAQTHRLGTTDREGEHQEETALKQSYTWQSPSLWKCLKCLHLCKTRKMSESCNNVCPLISGEKCVCVCSADPFNEWKANRTTTVMHLRVHWKYIKHQGRWASKESSWLPISDIRSESHVPLSWSTCFLRQGAHVGERDETVSDGGIHPGCGLSELWLMGLIPVLRCETRDCFF